MRSEAIYYFVLALVAVVVLGFIGYNYGFLGAVYNVLMPEAFSNYSILSLGIVLGVAAFFSPCAFTVLPSFVSHYLSRAGKEKLSRAVTLGVYAALGIIVVNMAIGLVIALLGAAAPFAKDPRQDAPLILGIRAFAGLAIAALGLMTLAGKSFHLPFANFFAGGKEFSKSMFGYGVLYNASAVGCTGPIMLGLVLYALASGSFNAALLAFAVFSLTMGALMVAVTVFTAALKSSLAEPMAQAAPLVRKAAAIVMVFVGLGVTLLTLEGNKILVQLFFPFLK